jgi:acetyl esterase/lipase
VIVHTAAILDLPPPVADARLRYGADPHQFGDLWLPAQAGLHPVAIVVHGGFWRAKYGLDHLGHLCRELARQGIASWSLEYRRLGHAGGGWPGSCEDVRDGAAYLRTLAGRYPLDPDRAVALGHSAGGQLALWLAAQRCVPLRGVVSLAGVTDLRQAWQLGLSRGVVAEFLGGSPGEVPERYDRASPIELLPLGVPQRLVHGDLDDTVPAGMSRNYQAAARTRGDDAVLLALPGAGHFELIDPRAPEWDTVSQAVRQLLG